MQKDFTKWNELKSKLQIKEKKWYFYEREIWFASIGLNLGDEQDGKGKRFSRPVIILKKFNQNIYWGIPLTTTEKWSPHYFRFEFNGERSTVILSQIRLMDRKRLRRKIGNISHENFSGLIKKIKLLFP